ncbi:hypothetical protein FRC07_013171, partial [Ceratobasidium sp. 392]
MGQLRNLRSLTISPAVLEPKVLRAVGTCPHLETLVIQSTDYGGPLYNGYDLDGASFPDLRHLELINIDPHTVENLCSFQPLLRQLEHASITFGDGDDEAWDFDGDRVELLYTLVECCPRLSELGFDTGTYGDSIPIIPELIDLFRLRELRYLNLPCLQVGLGEPIGWNELLSGLPLLEELHTPYDTFQHPSLRLFATMLPRLRFWALSQVEFHNFDTSPNSKDLKKISNPSQIPVRLQSRFNVLTLEGCFETAARYLHTLWPNIIVETEIIEVWANHPTTRQDIAAAEHIN